MLVTRCTYPKEYGIDNLEFTVVCKGTEEYVKEMEVRVIQLLDTKAHSGYNLTLSGGGSTGWEPSDEIRKRMRDNHKGILGQKMSESIKREIEESRLKYQKGKHLLVAKVVINGISYDCIFDAAESLDIVYSTLCAYQRRLGTNVFDYPPEKEVFNINGVEYLSILEAVKALEVPKGTLYAAHKKTGSNTFEYKHHVRLQGSLHPKTVKVIINGERYGSLKEATDVLGVNYSTLRDARRRAESNTFTYNRGKTPKLLGE